MAQTISYSEAAAPWCLDILLVEGDVEARDAVAELLHSAGHRVHSVTDGMQAVATAEVQPFDIVIADVQSRVIDGFSLLSRLRVMSPQTHVILASESPSIEHAVAATNARADYLIKPLVSKNLLAPVASISRRREVQAHMAKQAEFDALVGRSPLIKALERALALVAQADGVVLISGEPGTGKELVARMVHRASSRSDGPLVKFDCAAVDPNTLVDELFGAGGRIDEASGGTLLLDHIEELTSLAQAKLMHGLDTGRFVRDAATDIRIVAITSCDLDAQVDADTMRADLVCRLKEFLLELPPLRRRRDDLPLLVEYFCHKHGAGVASPTRVSPEVWAILAAHQFPGNVRELELAIKHALAFAEGADLRVEHLPAELRSSWDGDRPPSRQPIPEVMPLELAVSAFEHQYLQQTLQQTDGNRTRAASLLGISRKSLWAKLKRYEQRHPLLTVAWQR